MPFTPQQLNLPPPGPGVLMQERGLPTGVVETVAGGAANGVASVTAVLVRNRSFAPVSAGTATVTATEVRIRALTAATAGTASISATVTRTRARAGSATGTATVTISLGRTRALAAASTGTATVTASMPQTKQFTATATGVATVTAGDILPAPQTAQVFGGTIIEPSTVRKPVYFDTFTRDIYLDAKSAGRGSVSAELTTILFADNVEAMFNDLETFLALELEPA